MAILQTMVGEYCVCWLKTDELDDYGQYQYGDPVEIKCRWQGVNEEVLTSEKQRVICNSKVLTNLEEVNKLSRVLEYGDYLWRGRLVDLPVGFNPIEEDDAKEIMTFKDIRKIRYDDALFIAMM